MEIGKIATFLAIFLPNLFYRDISLNVTEVEESYENFLEEHESKGLVYMYSKCYLSNPDTYISIY